MIEPICYESLLKKALLDFDNFSFVWCADLDFNDHAKFFELQLKKFLISECVTDNWPGTQLDGGSAIIRKYSISRESIEILKGVTTSFEFMSPKYPEDLAFYKENEVVYYSVAHERLECFFDGAS